MYNVYNTRITNSMLLENKGNPLQSCFAPISEFDELIYVYNAKCIIQ